MTALSFAERARRRGAMSLTEFSGRLRDRGFRRVMRGTGEAERFAHPDTGDRRYTRHPGEDYAATLERLTRELAAAREANTP